jgi:hypothetical protein
MVGDSVFPGQSVPAVMLAGLRVAQAVVASEALRLPKGSGCGDSSFDRLLNTG